MRSSYIWAVLITVAIGGWLASGTIIVGGRGDTSEASEAAAATDAASETGAAPAAAREEKPFRVRVRTIAAVERTAELKVRGRTEAAERVTLMAQTPGLVEKMPVRKGQRVAAGDVICKIEAGSRTANILRAEAGLAQAELDYDGAKTLNEKGFAAETKVRTAKAAMHAARAVLAEARLDLERTEIRASFDGIIDTLPPKIGTLLNVGDPCAELVAADPMLVVAQVSERDVGRIGEGMKGSARLVTGDTAEGALRFVAETADEATRTFRIELSVPNPDERLRDGVTAEIVLPLETTRAHRFSPAILTLDDKGQIGVRAVGADNRVEFMPVRILGNENGAVWVAGLPDTVTVITVGQDFISEGETVEPVFETASDDSKTGNATQ